ncbi:hypothetical protein FPV67DRAFT_1667598 [Lyophyllum atratum]|nr:hypothetical protein FPV67DRAFT_1667598 [Lyophyllum atratum]
MSTHIAACVGGRESRKKQKSQAIGAARDAQQAESEPEYIPPRLAATSNRRYNNPEPGTSSSIQPIPDTSESYTQPRLLQSRRQEAIVAPDADTADDRYRPPRLKASTCKPVSKPQNAIPSAVGRQSQDSGREPLAPTQPRAPQRDDFRTTYHPSSGRGSRIETFGSKKAASSVPFLDPKPWLPFRSQTEFKFAEIMLDSAMSNKHVDALIDVIRALRDGDEDFVVESHKDLETLWSSAAGMHGLSPFEPHIITVNYKGEPRSFTSWQRPFMSWILTCLEDKYLGSVCEWDAIKTEKFDGKKWQGYPIMANLTNFPEEIRNSHGLGSTQVVGWLPIVPEEESEKKSSPDFVDFKKAVWHASFKKLLENVAEFSKVGILVNCGDGVTRRIYPFIFLLAADYEEQAIMTLTRGVQSKFPCPIWEGSKALVVKCMKMKPKAAEEKLKEESLRLVYNAFWDVNFSGPHEAIGFDDLHVNDGGVGGRHLWPLVVAFLHKLGADAKQKVDDQVKALPRWSGLSHFDNVVSVSFSDGNKWRDILKLTICITHNVLTEDLAPIGYVVLRCVRAYVDAVMWENLPVHTTETIAAGRKAVERLGACMMELDEVMREDGTFSKSFDFPKLHAHRHVFDLILAMGALCHSTTRLFEGRHIALKKWYQNKTNFKDTEEQILKYEFFRLVAYTVSNYVQRNCIDGGLESRGLDPADKKDSQTAQQFNNIYLGAPQKHTSFFKLEEDNHKDPAFHGFRHRVQESLNNILTRDDSPVQLSGKLSISPNAYLTEYRFIKADFESQVDWRAYTDYLRCSPSFHHAPRYDCVLIHSKPNNYFARLIFVFTYNVPSPHDDTRSHVPIPMALVQPFATMKDIKKKDVELRLLRLKEDSRKASIVIPARSIIRGAYIVHDNETDRGGMVIDTVDGDMFLRMQDMFPPSDE